MARDPYTYFRVEARQLADQLGQGVLELERSGSGGEIVPRLLRLAHTLKGAARIVRQPEIAEAAHAIEDVLSPFRELAATVPAQHVAAILRLIDAIADRVAALSPPESNVTAPHNAAVTEEAFRSVGANVSEVDSLLDGVTEAYAQVASLRETGALSARARRAADQLVEQVALARKADRGGSLERFTASADEFRHLTRQLERGIAGAHERIERELRQIRAAAEQLRLMPASALFPALQRAARDSAQALGKQVVFESKGGDIRLDSEVVRLVQEALVQVIRNAVAHGVETPRERAAAGKPHAGRVSVEVARRGRRVAFLCRDDGRGIDVEALRQAAIHKGRSAAELDRLDAGALVRVLLQGGISTAAHVTEVSGRGIGMDIVREAVARLAGDFVVNTEPGAGTTFELVAPVSVSSVEALVVESGGVIATLPLDAVRHTVRLVARDVHLTALGDAIIYDGKATPLVSLAQLVGGRVQPRRGASASVVVIAGPTGTAAIMVDRLVGTSNIVVRPLPELAPASALVAGASLDAGGRPLLMLDPEGLVAAALDAGDPPPEAVVARRRLLVIDDSLTTRMLEQSILESAGYQVDVATSAEEGLASARRSDYALILVDVEMPGMDGFTFIEQIRRDAKLSRTPAILVTSRAAPEDKRRGQEVGAQDYVVKSDFDQAELLRRIKQLVS